MSHEEATMQGHDADHLVGPAVRGAIECALWTGTQYGADTEVISEDLRGFDVPADVEQTIRQDVEDFVLSNADDCLAYVAAMGDAERIGHDFMLTRNGHGAGFWDRGLGDLGDRLTAASKPYGDQSIEADQHGNLFLL